LLWALDRRRCSALWVGEAYAESAGTVRDGVAGRVGPVYMWARGLGRVELC